MLVLWTVDDDDKVDLTGEEVTLYGFTVLVVVTFVTGFSIADGAAGGVRELMLLVVVVVAALSVGFSEATGDDGGGGASLLGALDNDLGADVVDSELV